MRRARDGVTGLTGTVTESGRTSFCNASENEAGEASSARAPGGGARSDLWLRICASVLDVPIERTVVEEGSAFGAALLGGAAGGVFADVSEAVASAVHTKHIVEPDPEWARVYGEQHQRYRALYPALREVDRSTVAG